MGKEIKAHILHRDEDFFRREGIATLRVIPKIVYNANVDIASSGLREGQIVSKFTDIGDDDGNDDNNVYFLLDRHTYGCSQKCLVNVKKRNDTEITRTSALYIMTVDAAKNCAPLYIEIPDDATSIGKSIHGNYLGYDERFHRDIRIGSLLSRSEMVHY